MIVAPAVNQASLCRLCTHSHTQSQGRYLLTQTYAGDNSVIRKTYKSYICEGRRGEESKEGNGHTEEEREEKVMETGGMRDKGEEREEETAEKEGGNKRKESSRRGEESKAGRKGIKWMRKKKSRKGKTRKGEKREGKERKAKRGKEKKRIRGNKGDETVGKHGNWEDTRAEKRRRRIEKERNGLKRIDEESGRKGEERTGANEEKHQG